MTYEDDYFNHDYLVSNCELLTSNNGSYTAYIPSKFAEIGRKIIINGSSVTVKKVFGFPCSYNHANKFYRNENFARIGKSTSELDIKWQV